MSIQEKNNKTQIDMNPYKQMNSQTENKVKMIYERYRTGKSIIMDDLRYLWLKDPEGCEKIARSIVESKTGKESEAQHNNIETIGYAMSQKENIKDQQYGIEYKSPSDIQNVSVNSVMDTMFTVKSMMEKMNESDLVDMLKNLNKEYELKKHIKNMNDWDDMYLDKLVMYSYDAVKKFNILA